MTTINVLFVCMGNICRSPTAQVIFEKLIEEANLQQHFFIASAGTHAAEGHSPDLRSKNIAKNHDLTMGHILSQQITLHDFHFFDYIIAMDQDNLEHLMSICPKSQQHKISLLLSYASQLNILGVPDPYSGGPDGFDKVFEIISQGTKGLLITICKVHHLDNVN